MRHWTESRTGEVIDLAFKLLAVVWVIGMTFTVPTMCVACAKVSDDRAHCAGMCGRLGVDGHEVEYVGESGQECWCRTSSVTKVRVYERAGQ